MNRYSEFVNLTFDAVSHILPNETSPYIEFSYGRDHSKASGDYAFLKNKDAILFHSILLENADLFNIDSSKIKLFRSKLYNLPNSPELSELISELSVDPSEVSIWHSCYARNLHRWMNGQTSRKRRCRAEYVVLLYCWSTDWKSGSVNSNTCTDRLYRICELITSSALSDSQNLLKQLWDASELAYSSDF